MNMPTAILVFGKLLSALVIRLPQGLALSAHHAFRFCGRAWFSWAILWLAMIFFSKSTKRRESRWQRLEHLLPAAIGFFLIFNENWRVSWLALPIFPDAPGLMLLCVVVTVFGLLFAVWARVTLGANWSGSVTIKTNHQLVRRGPYRFVRHPIYTGMLAALLATVITQQLLGGLLGFVVVLLALYRKARREESFLSQEFGDAFVEHRLRTGMFLPRLS
jgi:protein-S-isoprenylcysteine O-methyltransferase Ste14